MVRRPPARRRDSGAVATTSTSSEQSRQAPRCCLVASAASTSATRIRRSYSGATRSSGGDVPRLHHAFGASPVFESGLTEATNAVNILFKKHRASSQAPTNPGYTRTGPTSSSRRGSPRPPQVGVDGVLYLQVMDARKASYGIGNYLVAIAQLAQTLLGCPERLTIIWEGRGGTAQARAVPPQKSGSLRAKQRRPQPCRLSHAPPSSSATAPTAR